VQCVIYTELAVQTLYKIINNFKKISELKRICKHSLKIFTLSNQMQFVINRTA